MIRFTRRCPGCGGPVGARALACQLCWDRLPPALQRAAYTAYSPRAPGDPRPTISRRWRYVRARIVGELQQLTLFPQEPGRKRA